MNPKYSKHFILIITSLLTVCYSLLTHYDKPLWADTGADKFKVLHSHSSFLYGGCMSSYLGKTKVMAYTDPRHNFCWRLDIHKVGYDDKTQIHQFIDHTQDAISLLPSTMSIDIQNNIIIAGEKIKVPDRGIFIIKLDSNLNILWSSFYNKIPNSYHDKAKSIITDPKGNIYILGIEDYSVTLVKYDADGTLIWDQSIGVSEIEDIVKVASLKFDPTGNILVCCHRYMKKISPEGVILWGCLSPDQSLFIDCQIYQNSIYLLDSQACIYCLDLYGTIRWSRTPKTSSISPCGIRINHDGNIVMGGTVNTTDITTTGTKIKQFYVCLFEQNGWLNWEKTLDLYSDTLSSWKENVASTLCVGQDNNIYITGTTCFVQAIPYTSLRNPFIVRINNEGKELWRYSPNHYTPSTDLTTEIDLAEIYVDQSIYITIESDCHIRHQEWDERALIKIIPEHYSNIDTGQEPNQLKLIPFPNPSQHEIIHLNLESGVQSPVKISIYDLLGKQIDSFDSIMNPGRQTIQWNPVHLPSGIYFIKAEANGWTDYSKITILK
ncbi:MAG: T9SS type A sorting domain-containing protein [Candidatus Delongbacteria bacterium]|nr:T9SS type A sorting domain-containing protein [Candidatus Delongbacteria bacterium]